MRTFSLVASVFVVGVSAAAAPVYVGTRERVAVDVGEGETRVQDARVVATAPGRLYKTGLGTWTLPRTSFVQNEAAAVAVCAGTLVLPKEGYDAPAVPAAPTDVLQRAGLWVTTAKNVATTNDDQGVSYVTGWYDARETDAAATVYGWAQAGWCLNDTAKPLYGVPPTLETNVFGGTGVYFGGYGSSKCMYFRTPSGGTLDLTSIAHVFLVTGIKATYGYTICASTGESDFHIASYNGVNGNTNSPYWNGYGVDAKGLNSGAWTYVDGVRVDGFTMKPKHGLQLLEMSLFGRGGHAMNFFNDRQIAGRSGGDYLYEAIVFTNRLTEVDRLRVEGYLLDTWNLRKGAPPVTVTAGAGAQAEFPVPEGGTAERNRFEATGAGTVVKSGAGAARIEQPLKTAFAGQVRVDAGTAVLAAPAALALAAGTAVTVADAPPGTVVKRGAGPMRVTAVPADVKTISAEAGTLVLAAAPTNMPSLAPGGVVAATIPDPSFEDAASESAAVGGRIPLSATPRFGWAGSVTSDPWTLQYGDRSVFFYGYEHFVHADQPHWPCSYPAPDGAMVLAIKGDSQAWTTVTVPQDGVYELSFWTSARYSASSVNTFDVLLGDSTDSLSSIGCVWQAKAPYNRRIFRTPHLTAGDHVLMLRAFSSNIDGCTTFDDFRMTLVPENDPAVWPVPNGDFEASDGKRTAAFSVANRLQDWELDTQGFWAGKTYPSVGVASSGMELFRGGRLYQSGETAYGQSVLVLAGTGGVARTTFSPPPGTYRLQVDHRMWTGYWNSGVDMRGRSYADAWVTVGSAAKRKLGTLNGGSYVYSTGTFADSFTVAAGESVTLELVQTMHNGVILLDNLVLVADRADLVKNGSFDEVAYWTNEPNNTTPGTAKGAADWQNGSTTFSLQHYPGGGRDSAGRVILTQRGCIRQDVTFPTDGPYRLNASLLSRHPQTYAGQYGENPVRFWLARGAETNVIAWTEVKGTNWIDRSWLFRPPSAGTFTFGIQGMVDGENGTGTDRSSMVDAVSIVPADVEGAETPGLSKDLCLVISDGARLRLDFPGTNEVCQVRLAGISYAGVIDARSHPALVSGPGALFVRPKGTVLLFR